MRILRNIWAAIIDKPLVFEANEGKSVDVLVIKHGDTYLTVNIDCETRKPTGEFGWSEGSAMVPPEVTPIRNYFKTVRLYED